MSGKHLGDDPRYVNVAPGYDCLVGYALSNAWFIARVASKKTSTILFSHVFAKTTCIALTISQGDPISGGDGASTKARYPGAHTAVFNITLPCNHFIVTTVHIMLELQFCRASKIHVRVHLIQNRDTHTNDGWGSTRSPIV